MSEFTPGDGQGEGGDGGQPFDFQRGYEQLRPEYTRATQELASHRERLSEYEALFDALHDDSDPEAQAQAMAALGLELDTGSPGPQGAADEEFVDPLEEQLADALKRVEQLEGARELETSQREQQRLDDLRDEYIGEAITYIEDSLKPQFGDNFKFTAREEEALGNLAIAMADEDAVPNVQAAYNLLYGDEGVLETNRSRWIATKTNAAVPPAGTMIPADRKPANRRERIAYIDERVAALDRQQ